MNVAIIIGMLTATVASSIAEGVMNSTGKIDESKYLNWATKAGMGATALASFVTLVKALRGLG